MTRAPTDVDAKIGHAPRTDLQRRLLDYLRTVGEDGVARVTQDELSAAMNTHRGSVNRAMRSLLDHGFVTTVNPVRATFVTLPPETTKPPRPGAGEGNRTGR